MKAEWREYIHSRNLLLAATGLFGLCFFLLTGCGSPGATPTHTATPSTTSDQTVNRPVATTGCNKTPLAGTNSRQTIMSGGIQRFYYLHIPAAYNKTTQMPVILVFHGHGGKAEKMERETQISNLPVIAVYPMGTTAPGGKSRWNTYGPRHRSIDDVLFVSDMLNQLQATLCVDPARIYATGISNGGGMTGLLACKLAGRVAAFAPVAGAFFYPLSGGCQPGRPVPILEFHGTSDPLVPYEGKPASRLPAIPQWLQEWASRDGCTGGPATFFHKDDVTGLRWNACSGGSEVVHYRITGGGHTWPGSPITFLKKYGKTTQTISATQLMWQFFRAHPLPQ